MEAKANRLALVLGVVAAGIGLVAIVIEFVQGNGLSTGGTVALAVGLVVIVLLGRRRP